MMDFEPYLSVRSTHCTIFEMSTYPTRNKYSTGGNLYQKSNHLITKNAATRIREIVNILSIVSKSKSVYHRESKKWYSFKLSFVTLTIPVECEYDDKKMMKKLFIPFLKEMKRKYPELLYIYKMEVQDNGRIHMHLTTNIFIHHKKLRKIYTNALYNAGVIKEKKEYPCTDIHAVRNIKNIAAYISSYICKKDIYTKRLKRWLCVYKKKLADTNREYVVLPKNYFNSLKRKVECRLWDCSKVLKKKTNPIPYYTQKAQEIINELKESEEYVEYKLEYSCVIPTTKIKKKNMYIKYIRECYEDAINIDNMGAKMYEIDDDGVVRAN